MSITDQGSSDFLAAAFDYRNRGWRIIALHPITSEGVCSCHKGAACTSAGKHPINNKWQDSERMSSADIHSTWEGRDNPPNLGIAVGAPSGFWVLDIDPEHGGMETMAALVAQHGKLPETFVVQSGSGGYHYYFKMAGDLRNSQNRVGQGIDTRASGGQVVAAPSRTDKGSYTVVVDAPLAAAPEWLLALVRKAEPTGVEVTAADLPKPEDIEPAEWDRLNRYAKNVVDREVKRLDDMRAAAVDAGRALETYRGEPWNATTFQVSCSLLEIANSPWNHYSVGQAYDLVTTHAPRDAGFDDDEVNKTFESARNKVGDQARPVPPKPEPSTPADALFDSPDVRSGPTEADGGRVDPVSGGHIDFFDHKEKLLTANLAHGVSQMGPIGIGADSLFWVYENGVWGPDNDVVDRRVGDLLGNQYRTGHVSNVEGYLRTRITRINGTPLAQFINFRNGMLDWQTGELLEHDPAYHSTIQMQVDWVPDAQCPTFDLFLADVLHPDYVDLCWQMIGYLIFSGNDFQKAFMLYGNGGNGKGTLLRVIENLIGRHNLAAESLDDLNRSNFSSVNLYGKIANIAGDIDSTYQEQTAAFKKITGEDNIGAQHKYGKLFYFENWAVPVFSANKLPGSADVTDGYLRRWVLIHFHKKIKTDDQTQKLSDLLSADLEGIAVKAVAALQRLMLARKFIITGEAQEGEDLMRLAVDQVFRWVRAEEGSSGPLVAPQVETSIKTLHAAYRAWADQAGERPLPERVLLERLDALGYPSTEHGMIRGLSVPNLLAPTTPVAGETASADFFG